jgi:acetylornithine deacetylase/succinyl-diaminopimelate desuccinylase-like protein
MNTTEMIKELREFLRLPSAAADAAGLRGAADWLAHRLRAGGWEVRVEDDGATPPLLAAERGAGPLLAVYSHYDVVNPLRSEWRHEPFGADRVEDRVIACGARDAKANLLGAVRAGETAGGVRVLLLFEGEEKRESPRLLEFARRALAGRQPVGFLCADGGGYTERDEPTMELGLKGQLALEVEVGPGTPGVPPTSIHSGHATLTVNPNELLARFLASLKDDEGQVTLEDFYASLQPPERPYREPLAGGETSFLDTLFARYGYGLRAGETRAHVMNRLMFHPELNIASVRSGETGLEKRIVPARASARLDLNLVPGQEPERVLASVRQRLGECGIEPDRSLRVLAARPAYRCPPDDPFAVAACESLAEAHPDKPVIVLPSSGSSGPVSGLPRTFGRPLVRLGTGYRGHAHTPDEAVKVEHYRLYIETLRTFFGKVGRL